MKASERAYEELRRDIVDWRLSPGAPLAEVEQAERLGLSRTPVREAIARLVADGLAVAQQGRVSVSEISIDSVDHLFDLREALEVTAARLAARGEDRGVFSELAKRFRAAEATAATAPLRYYDLAGELDVRLDEAVDNPYLAHALRTLRVHLARVRRLSQDHPERLVASTREHAAIAAAIAAGDAELAAAATVMHLRHAHAHIKDHATDHSVAAPTELAPSQR